MISINRLIVLTILGMIVAVPQAGAQSAGANSQTSKFDPQAVRILQESLAVYRRCQTYQDQGKLTATIVAKDKEHTESANVKLLFERPNRISFTWSDVVMTCDGAKCLVYYTNMKVPQFIVQSAPAKLTSSFLEGALNEQSLTMVLNGLTSPKPFEAVSKDMHRLENAGTTQVADRTCKLIRFWEGQNQILVAIDSETKLIRRITYIAEDPRGKLQVRVDYSRVEVDEPVDASAFKIREPAQARKVDRVSYTRWFDFPMEGKKIPANELKVISTGKKTTIASMLGRKLTFVTFWATWCGPCRLEMPILESLYQENKDRGLQIIGVNVDAEPNIETIRDIVSELGVTFPMVQDLKLRLQDSLSISEVPTLLILDPSGKIIEAHVGTTPDTPQALRWTVEKYLSK